MGGKEIGFRIRPYENGDEYQIVRLFGQVFNQEITVEQWRWKYKHQELRRIESVVAIDEKDKIIGHFGGIPVRMRFRGEDVIAYQAVDVMVHNDYRGGLYRKGVYFRMGKMFYEGLPSFVYGFSNFNHLRLGEIMGFFEDAIEVPDLKTETKKYMLPLYGLESMGWDDKDIDTLWNKTYNSLGWVVKRDKSFLNWRYKDNAFRSYNLYGMKKRFSKRLLGWIAIRDAGDELLLMDMMCHDKYLEELLKKTISLAHRLDKKRVVTWLSNKYASRLATVGFKQFRRGTYIPNFVWVKRAESLEMKKQLYYTMGDTDFL